MKNKNLLGISLLIGMPTVLFLYFHNNTKIDNDLHPSELRKESHYSLSNSCIEKEKLLSMLNTQMRSLKQKSSVDCLNHKNLYLPGLPIIYVITPTFTRPVQKAELTRLSHAFMLVPNLHWIIVEDSEEPTKLVRDLLTKTGLPFTLLHVPTPKNYKLTSKDPHWSKPRGVIQRNAALDWIHSNVAPGTEGVVYFADDDNTYSIEIFKEMRWVRGVGVWPVGLVGGVKVERPKVDENGKVVGWLTLWGSKRRFAIDMAGFALSIKKILSVPLGRFAYEVQKGNQESEFLKQFVNSLDELEPRADLCTKVYVWHTRTEAPNLVQEEKNAKLKKPPTDLGIEV